MTQNAGYPVQEGTRLLMEWLKQMTPEQRTQVAGIAWTFDADGGNATVTLLERQPDGSAGLPTATPQWLEWLRKGTRA